MDSNDYYTLLAPVLLTVISGHIAQSYDAGWVVWVGMALSTLSLGLLLYLRGVQVELNCPRPTGT